MLVVPGSASRTLAEAVAKELGARLVQTEVKTFPDGEVYTRILDPLEGEPVVVVETTFGNDRFVELLLLLDAARALKPSRLVAVLPYFAYSRQDRRFQPGEALSAEVVAKTVGLYADALVTVDPHKDAILGFFPKARAAVSAVPELAAHFQSRGVDLVLAPDQGALERARVAAGIIHVAHDYLEKTRISSETVVMKPKALDVKGKRVAILDDIISTGGTMAKAAEQLLAQGAAEVYCAATHGVFVGGAPERLRKAGVREVVTTDTIATPESRVSAAPAVARGVREVLKVARTVGSR